MKSSLVVSCLFALVAVSATAETELITVIAEGAGQNHEDSVFNALASAVRQEHGAKISSRRVVTQSHSELVLSAPDGEETKVSLSAGSEGRVTAAASGLISGYRVLSSSTDGGLFRTRLEVTIPKYLGPGLRSHETRRELAVYPFSAKGTLTLFGTKLSNIEFASKFTQEVVERFTRSRRFTVLERRRMNEVMAERSIIGGSDVPVIEKAKLGNILGADYVVYGEIKALDIDTSVHEISVSGEQHIDTSGGISVDIRIISPATNQIHWADSIQLDGRAALHDFTGTSLLQARQEVIDAAAAQLVRKSIQAIYPIRIVQRSMTGELVLNQGGPALSAGEHLELYLFGDNLRDPYTGENLGRSESFVAMLEVVRVDSKLSYARVLDSADLSSNYEDYVVRFISGSSGAGRAQDDAAMERGTRRRVLLPQDGR